MNIKILGLGCAKCHKLGKIVREVVDELNLEATVEDVEDMMKILDFGLLTMKEFKKLLEGKYSNKV